MEITWRFSPSGVEEFFRNNLCERALLYSGLSDDDREQYGFLPKGKSKQSAPAIAGDRWEQDVYDALSKDSHNIIVDCEIEELKNAKTADERLEIKNNNILNTTKEIKNAIKTILKTKSEDLIYYLYQPCFGPKKEFISILFGNPTGITIAPAETDADFFYAKMDFLKLYWEEKSKQCVLKIIDVKLAQKPKIEHKIQISIYKKILAKWEEDELDDNTRQIKCKIDEFAAIINFPNALIEKNFELSEAEDFLKICLLEHFPTLAEKVLTHDGNEPATLANSLDYSIGETCEYCPNYKNCRRYCEENEPYMLLPYMSSGAPHLLKTIRDSKDIPSLPDNLSDFFNDWCNKNGKYIEDNSYFREVFRFRKEHIQALCKKELVIREGNAADFLVNEDIEVILTAQKDWYYDLMYFWGIYIHNKKDSLSMPDFSFLKDNLPEGIMLDIVNDNNDVYLCIFVSEQIGSKEQIRNSFKSAEELFIDALYYLFSTISDMNKRLDAEISMQTYVMDRLELDNIEKVLLKNLPNRADNTSDSNITKREKILFWLNGEDFVGADTNKPNEVSFLPVIILTSVISRLFILPEFIQYNLSAVVNNFIENANDDELAQIEPSSEFVGELSNTINSDSLIDFWEKKKEDYEKIGARFLKHMQARLHLESMIPDAIREKLGITDTTPLFALSAKPFILNEECQSGDVGKLSFFVRYEDSLGKQEQRLSYLAHPEKSIEDCKLLKITKLETREIFTKDKKVKAQICTANVENLKGLDKPYYRAILIEDTPQNRILLQTYTYLGDEIPKGAIEVKDIKELNKNQIEFTTKPEKKLKESGFFLKKAYLLSETYDSDSNPQKTLKAIKSVVGNEKAWIMSPDTKPVREFDDTPYLYSKIGDYDFESNQRKVFEHVYTHNFTLLQGPPGTGKTDFIARTIYALACEAKQKNKPFRVLVTSNSNDAIDNVLKKIVENNTELIKTGANPLNNYYRLIKSYKSNEREEHESKFKKYTQGAANLKFVADFNFEKTVEETNSSHFLCFGTLWKISDLKDKTQDYPFDLIIIDEASQVRFVDALIPLECGDKNTRYLIVGDENQLPAIIHGQYEKNPEQIFMFGSVFKYYYDYDRLCGSTDSIRCMLTKEFRMNEMLCVYPNRAIYRKEGFGDYSAYEKENTSTEEEKYAISKDKFEYTSDSIDKLIDAKKKGSKYADAMKLIMDADVPFVLCCLKGNVPSEIKEAEIKWVKDVTRIVQNLYDAPANKEPESTFWEKQYAIVSPHHEHIAKLRNAISETASDDIPVPNGWKNQKDSLKIGTVDKLQGSERQFITVSYGITDGQSAMDESNFIYNRNRLNVSLTRSKKKTVMFVADDVLDCPIDLLRVEEEDLINGIRFVSGLKILLKELTNPTSISHGIWGDFASYSCENGYGTIDIYRLYPNKEQFWAVMNLYNNEKYDIGYLKGKIQVLPMIYNTPEQLKYYTQMDEWEIMKKMCSSSQWRETRYWFYILLYITQYKKKQNLCITPLSVDKKRYLQHEILAHETEVLQLLTPRQADKNHDFQDWVKKLIEGDTGEDAQEIRLYLSGEKEVN